MADTAEAALARVRTLAQSWVALEDGGDMAAEVDANVGRHLLNVAGGSDPAAEKVDQLTGLAETWMTPGSLDLYYPAAGQCVLDAIKGDPAQDWQARAEAAEARLAAVRDLLRGEHGSWIRMAGIWDAIGDDEEPKP